MQIKLVKFSMLPAKSMANVEIKNESTYKVTETNVRDFYCDINVDFTVHFTNIGKDTDEFSIIRASYLVTDVPSDNSETKKTVTQVAVNEMRNLIKDLTVQMTIDRNLNIVPDKKENINFFDDGSKENDLPAQKDDDSASLDDEYSFNGGLN